MQIPGEKREDFFINKHTPKGIKVCTPPPRKRIAWSPNISRGGFSMEGKMKLKPLKVKCNDTTPFFKELWKKQIIKQHLKMEALRRKMRREVGLS